MVRIGIVTHNFPRTALDRQDAGIFLYDFASDLSSKAQIFVLCPDRPGRKERFKNIKVSWFKFAGNQEKLGSWNLFNPISSLSFINLIRTGAYETEQFVRKNKLDILLACWALPAGLLANFAKRRLNIPYIAWSLGSDINRYARIPILRQLIIRTLADADLRLANSYALIEAVKSLTSQDCQFLPAITKFEVDQIPRVSFVRRGFNFLFVGRLEKVKGPDILVAACQLLSDKKRDFNVYIVGSGSLFDQLTQQVKMAGLDDKIFFLGQKGALEIASLMKSADCLVIPSRSESLPLVLIEGAKAGLPIVATDVGDCARLIKQYKLGMVVKSGDVLDLANKMRVVTSQGTSFKQRYRPGLKRLTKDFVLEKAVDEMMLKIGEIL